MYIEFLRLLETIDKSVLISDLPSSDMILQILNISQIRYLKEIYFKDGNYEIILNKADELRDLVSRELANTALITTGPMKNIGSTVDLSGLTNFMFYIRSDSKIVRSAMPIIGDYSNNTGAEWIPNEYIKYEVKDKFLTTPINKPIIVKPGCYIENDSINQLVILYDSFTKLTLTDGISIEFIKEPSLMTMIVSCELPNFMHEDIVKFAVDLYINNYKFRLSGINQSQKQQ